MPMLQRGLLGSAGKLALHHCTHMRPFHLRPSPVPGESDLEESGIKSPGIKSPGTSPPSPTCRLIHDSPSTASDSSSLSEAPLAQHPSPKALASTCLAIIKALSLTQWCNSKWWPDTSLLSLCIHTWPSMSNAFGCVQLLNSPQSLLARPDQFGNYLTNKKFFQKYTPPPLSP